MIKAKWYPLVLVVLFSLFFGLQVSLFVGLAVGYVSVWGGLARIELGASRATLWENKNPFKRFASLSFFVTAGASMGGTILPLSQPRSEEPVAEATNFKAFSGKATSLSKPAGAPAVVK